MKRKRYTEEKIISMLKQHEGGRTMVELAREHGIAENTLYRWKSKYGGMEVSEAKRLRERQAENRPLKHLLGEAELDKAAIVGFSRSAAWRPLKGCKDEALRNRLKTLSERYPRYGYPALHDSEGKVALVIARTKTYVLFPNDLSRHFSIIQYNSDLRARELIESVIPEKPDASDF